MIGKSGSNMGSVGAALLMLISDAGASILANTAQKGKYLQELYIAATRILGLDRVPSPQRIDFHCEEFDGRHLFADSRGSLLRYLCAGVGLRASRKDAVTIVYGLAAVLALFLFGYLLYALLRAEHF